MRVLTVEKDPALSSLLSQCCQERGLSLEMVKNLEELNTKKLEEYLAVFVQGNFLDQSLEHAAQNIIGHSTLVAISETPLSLANYKHLKENLGYPFVFETPIDVVEIRGIFYELIDHKISSQDIFFDIRVRYDNTIFTKLERIEHLISNIQHSENKDPLVAFQHEVKNLSETSEAHGYFFVSQYCNVVDQETQKVILAPSETGLHTLQERLRRFFQKLKLEFQLNGYKVDMENEIATSFALKGEADVYLIATATSFTEKFQKFASGCGINVQQIAPEMVSQATKPLSLGFLLQDGKESGEQLIRRLKFVSAKHMAQRWGVFDFRGTFEERVEAMKAGASFFCETKSPLMDLISIIDTEFYKLKRNEEPKTLFILSSDSMVTQKIQSDLQGFPFSYQSFSNGSSLFDALQSQKPDGVIATQEPFTDASIKAIHANYLFNEIPFLLLKEYTRNEPVQNVEDSVIQDVLIQPFSPIDLKSKVLNLLDRKHALDSFQYNDALTNAYTHEKFIELFQKELNRDLTKRLIFTLFQLDLDNKDLPFDLDLKETVLFQAGHLLNHEFPSPHLIGRLNENQFGLLLKNLDEAQADTAMKIFSQKFIQKLYIPDFQNLKITTSYASSSFPTEGNKVLDLYFVAFEKLKKKREERLIDERKVPSPQRDILIVDPDEFFSGLLCAHLQGKGLICSVVRSGQSALEKLRDSKIEKLPSFIVLERLLEDMDGRECMRQINKMFPDKAIPFCFVSIRSTQEDILEGLKEGALDYLPKPLNLSFLSEKIYNLMEQRK